MKQEDRSAYDNARRKDKPGRIWYSTQRWQNVRAAQLRAQPMCASCKARGVDRPATVCHHVVKHEGNASLFWHGPYASLCASCHDSDEHSREMGGRGRPLVDLDGWPSDKR